MNQKADTFYESSDIRYEIKKNEKVVFDHIAICYNYKLFFEVLRCIKILQIATFMFWDYTFDIHLQF